MVLEEWELSGIPRWAVLLKAINSISFTSGKQRVNFHHFDDGTRRPSLEPGAVSELNDPPQSSLDECISEIIPRLTACDATRDSWFNLYAQSTKIQLHQIALPNTKTVFVLTVHPADKKIAFYKNWYLKCSF